MKAKRIGLYVHIPFCVKKCNYCDFCSFPTSDIPNRTEYISALCEEISSYKEKEVEVDSIFFGGGTPSLLDGGEFLRIVEKIKESFKISDDCEFTVECNPKTLTEEKLRTYTSCGGNRISLGLQSIHENELKSLGRIHTFDDFLQSYSLVRSCGFDNVNVDLMYGIPEQTDDSFKQTVGKILALSPEHISVYGLILEEGTPFYKMKDMLPLPSEDEECDMYFAAANTLEGSGYLHYEISNYAKPGYECKHNLKYWKCSEYIGVGAAAYSYFDSLRYGNTDNLSDYISGTSRLVYSSRVGCDELAYEYVMLALRLREGIALDEYESLFGKDFRKGREEKLSEFSSLGLLSECEGRIFLTEKGFYLSNYILTEII